MPVTIVEVGKASLFNYVGIAIIVLLILAVTCAVIKDRRHRRNEEGLTVVALILLFGSGFIGLSCRDIYASPKQDVNIAYVNTSYSGQFLLEGSFPKAEDLRKLQIVLELVQIADLPQQNKPEEVLEEADHRHLAVDLLDLAEADLAEDQGNNANIIYK